MQRQSKLLRTLNCLICFEDNDAIFSTETFVSIGCRHFFHLSCFRDYVITQREEDPCVSCCDRQRSCPVCRNHIAETKYEARSVNVQQMYERCTWQAFKRLNELSSKRDGAVAMINKIRRMSRLGISDKLVCDEYCTVLRYLVGNYGCGDGLKDFLSFLIEKISHRKNRYHTLYGRSYFSLPL